GRRHQQRPGERRDERRAEQRGERTRDAPGGGGEPHGSARAISTTATTTAAPISTYTKKRKASASERSGLSTGTGASGLDDVDRGVDDDPHHVHEVPVDARHLDPAVLLRRVVASERANGDHRQQQ